MDDGGFPSYKLPQSLRLRGAKNSDKYREEISSRMLVYDQTIQHTCIVINLYTNMTTLACMVVVKSLTKILRGRRKDGRTHRQM